MLMLAAGRAELIASRTSRRRLWGGAKWAFSDADVFCSWNQWKAWNAKLSKMYERMRNYSKCMKKKIEHRIRWFKYYRIMGKYLQLQINMNESSAQLKDARKGTSSKCDCKLSTMLSKHIAPVGQLRIAIPCTTTSSRTHLHHGTQ